MCCFGFYFMFNSHNTPLPNLDWLNSALSCFVILMLHIQISNSMLCMDHVLPNSRNRINLDCHVLRVQAYRFWINLERTEYHVVDVGFWIVLKLVIRWISFQFNLIGLSSLVMFVPSPQNPIRLYSCIRQSYHEWNVVISLVSNNVCF
jgi:hypothetical protein